MAAGCHFHRGYSPCAPSRPSPESFFVLDASVAVAWLFGEKTAPGTELAVTRLGHDEALVPQLWRLELRNCLLVATRRGQVTAGGSATRPNALLDLPIRTDTEPDLTIAFAFAEKHGFTFYDAIYLELASRHITPIATLDKALARAAVAESLLLV